MYGRLEARPTELTTMARQGHRDLMEDGLAQDLRSTQVSPRLLRLPRSQVTRPRLAMLRFPLGGQAKPLLRSLVCFLLWHFRGPIWQLSAKPPLSERPVFRFGKPCSIENSSDFERGTATS